MESFDLIEFLQKARDSKDPKRLFEIWEDCCRRYERKEIGLYELEEIKEVVWPNLEALATLKKIINAQPDEIQTNSKQRKIS